MITEQSFGAEYGMVSVMARIVVVLLIVNIVTWMTNDEPRELSNGELC